MKKKKTIKKGGKGAGDKGSNGAGAFEGISETDEDELLDEESLIESSDFDESRKSATSRRKAEGYEDYTYSSFRGSRRNLEKGKTDMDVLSEDGGGTSNRKPKKSMTMSNPKRGKGISDAQLRKIMSPADMKEVGI